MPNFSLSLVSSSNLKSVVGVNRSFFFLTPSTSSFSFSTSNLLKNSSDISFEFSVSNSLQRGLSSQLIDSGSVNKFSIFLKGSGRFNFRDFKSSFYFVSSALVSSVDDSVVIFSSSVSDTAIVPTSDTAASTLDFGTAAAVPAASSILESGFSATPSFRLNRLAAFDSVFELQNLPRLRDSSIFPARLDDYKSLSLFFIPVLLVKVASFKVFRYSWELRLEEI